MAIMMDEHGAPAGTGPAPIKDATTESFMADVIEASKEVPVIVDFWAPWCEPCKQLTPALEKAVTQAGGIVRLVKINVDENQELAAQMRVQSVPTVYGFKDGQPVDAFAGAQPESQVQAFIKRLTGGAQAPVEAALEKAKAALDAGELDTAEAIYGDVLGHDPGNPAAIAGLIRVALGRGAKEDARAIVDSLEPGLKRDGAIAAAITALELLEAGDESVDTGPLLARLEADPNDHEARFDLAAALYAGGRAEEALEELLHIVGAQRDWNDGAAKAQMLKIFEALGHADPVVAQARRKLSTVLFS